MRTTFVLIDYENVQPKSLAALKGDQPFRVVLFVGAGQAKVTFEVAESMQALGERASYVRISGNGPNALDFHIAYYVGRISREDPTASFRIISKDAGFDPLIAHLKSQKIFAARHKDLADIPSLKAANSNTATEKVEVVIANLRQRGASRPRTLKTLSSTIGSLFQKQLSDADIKSILAELSRRGHATVDGAKVTYSL